MKYIIALFIFFTTTILIAQNEQEEKRTLREKNKINEILLLI